MGRPSSKTPAEQIAILEAQIEKKKAAAAMQTAGSDPILSPYAGRIAILEKDMARAKRGFSGNPAAQFKNQRRSHELRLACINAEERYQAANLSYLETLTEFHKKAIGEAAHAIAKGANRKDVGTLLEEKIRIFEESPDMVLRREEIDTLRMEYEATYSDWKGFVEAKKTGSVSNGSGRIVANPSESETESDLLASEAS